MVERGVNNAVRLGRPAPQAVQVADVPAMDLRAGGRHGRLGLVGSRQSKYPVACVQQLTDDGGTDETARPGDEYANGRTSYRSGKSSIGG